MNNTMALASIDLFTLSTVHGGLSNDPPCRLNTDTIVDGVNRWGQAGALGGGAIGGGVGFFAAGVGAVPGATAGGIIGGTVGAVYGGFRGYRQARRDQAQCLAAQPR
jgi:hypothetical protein